MKINTAAFRLTACTAALTLAFPALAQQDTSSKDGGIPEVVVTASKRKESIQSVPMAVDAVTSSTLQKMNIQKFEDVEKLVPGLALSPADGRGQNISLRGVTFDPDTGASPTVQVYWNETPITASNAFRGLFDVGRIEVLRGPQGTLRGQTSPAGSITIGTERPDASAIGGRLVQTFGSRNQRNTQAAVNLPLIENQLAVRVAGLHSYSENGVRNRINGDVNSDRGEGGRISVLYQPTKSLEFLLVHQQLSSHMVNAPIVIGRPFPGQPGPELDFDDRTSVVEGHYQFYNKTKLTSLNVGWDLAGHKLSYIGGFQQSKETGDRDGDTQNVIPGYSNQQVVRFTSLQRTHELRFESTGARRWNYMIGAYYSYTDGPAEFVQTFPYAYLAPFTPPLEVTLKGSTAPGSFGKGSALFTDHRFALSDVDRIQFGVRVQKNKSYSQQYLEVFGQKSAALPEDRAHLSSKAWTGSASYSRNFSKDVMAYVSVANAYRAGGTTAFVTAPGIAADLINYRPEKSKSIELGIKSTLMQRRLVLNADVFQQNIKDYISRANTLGVRVGAKPGEGAGPGPGGSYPADVGSSVNLNTNGDVISRGIEASAIWSILPTWRAQISASYVDAHYDNAQLYCVDGNNDGMPDIQANFVQPGKQVSTCRSNRRLSDNFGTEAGKFSAVVQSEYSHPIGKVDLFVRGLARYAAPRYNLPNDTRLASFTPVDVYFGVRDPSQDWEISIWAQNVFDRSTIPLLAQGRSMPDGTLGGYYQSITPLQERKIGVTARYEF